MANTSKDAFSKFPNRQVWKPPELTSPGHLPDVLDTEKTQFGLSNRRNSTLTSHAVHILPYRGLGTGIPRAIDAWAMITLDELQDNPFKVVTQRAVEK
ncbi:ATP-binding protein [Pseudomonas lijiangensis]|uniref:ATP-binding protein n=1 Tax=Pseudomonas lijiangensis TaxID=2995658 RepID=UPI0020A68E0B|nr:ATP-binding protein [Pseudomonas lijiangensis]